MLTKQKFSFDSNGKLANCESRDPSKLGFAVLFQGFIVIQIFLRSLGRHGFVQGRHGNVNMALKDQLRLGTEVPPRKAFIYRHATDAELDV